MSEPKEILQDAAKRYCMWSDTGHGSLGPGAMAYDMYVSICRAIEAIDTENKKYVKDGVSCHQHNEG